MNRSSPALFVILLAAALAAQAQTAYRWIGKDGQVNYSDQPPPADAKDVRQKTLGEANSVDTSGPSYSMQKALQNYPVTLYSSVDCQAECKIARDFLKRRGIPFSEKTVRTNDDANVFKKATGIGEVAVPSLLVGTQAEKGYQKSAWNALLDAAGYPAPSR